MGLTIDNVEYLTREEFFAKERGGFQVNPLDMSMAKSQFELLQMARSELAKGKDSVETEFEMRNPLMVLSKVCIKCFLVTGSKDIYDLVMRVEDRDKEHFAYGWITMGSLKEIEAELDGSNFVLKCRRWAKWLDYARKNYPTEGGHLYYWTEWESIDAEKHWYDGDPDLYAVSSDHSHELLSKLITYYGHELPDGRLFEKDTYISCQYAGAPGRETKFDSMELMLHCYASGRIDLVGAIVYDVNFEYKPTRIIIHSFENATRCIWWLSRNSDTTRDCHLRMGNLLRCGRSYIRE